MNLRRAKAVLRRAGRRVAGRHYYRFVDGAFGREMDVVASGLVAYHDLREGGRHRYNLVRNIHMIEKGLTMKPLRETFAEGYIEETVDLWGMVSDDRLGLGSEELAWVADVLNAYFDATRRSGSAVIRRAAERATSLGLIPGAATTRGAVLRGSSGPHAPTTRADLVDISQLRELAENRRSVRWFLPDKVDRSVVDAAVTVAREAPTACNRQPYRFIVVDDDRVGDIAAIPMGTRGYSEQVPSIIVVVGDWSAYFDVRDRHLPYVDASLATMGLVLGLEAQGVATCCINWPDIPERERAMTEALGLAAHERVIMLVAYGYADPEGSVPFSAKRPLSAVRSFES